MFIHNTENPTTSLHVEIKCINKSHYENLNFFIHDFKGMQSKICKWLQLSKASSFHFPKSFPTVSLSVVISFLCYSVLAIFVHDICKASLVKYISTDPNSASLHVQKCNYCSTIVVKLLATECQHDAKFNSKRQSNWFYTM